MVRRRGEVDRLLLARTDLLVLDDWGMNCISEQETRDIPDIVDDRSFT